MLSKHVVYQKVILAGLLLFGMQCLGQTMQFSVYNGWSISSDGTTLYNAVSVVDSSSCSYHSGYMTTSQINTPDSRSASATGSGLAANVSIALNDVDGDYLLNGHGTYYCGCGFMNAGFGGGITIALRKTTYALVSWTPVSGCSGQRICSYYISCQPGTTATCGTGTYASYEWGTCGTCPNPFRVWYWWRGGSACTDIFVDPSPATYACT